MSGFFLVGHVGYDGNANRWLSTNIIKYWPPSYTRNLQHYRMLLFFKMVPVYHYEICQLLRSLEPTTFSIHHQQKVEAKGPVGPGPWSLKSEAEIISTPPKTAVK